MKVWERYVSIVPPTNAHTCAHCASFLPLLLQAYTILDMERIETKTPWTAPRVGVDSPVSSALGALHLYKGLL
jgi:hypothetical protein